MKSIYIYLGAIICLLCACSTDEHLPDVSKFYYPIPATPLKEAVNLGAYYYTYKTNDWNKGYPEEPELGEYDIFSNPQLMSRQFEWAVQGGLNYFILKWDNADNDQKLLTQYAQYYTPEAPKMVICYNIAHLKGTNASPIAEKKLAQMVTELKELYNDHMSKAHYFKIDNRPVIMITSLIPSSSQPNAIDFNTVMSTIRQEFANMNVNPYFIGEVPTGWKAPQTYKKSIITMDAITLTSWVPNDYDRSYAFCSFNDISWKNWCDSTSAWKMDYIPCIFPAYNDLVSNPKSKNLIVERTEKFFIDYCNVAKRNLGSKRFVIVNSWNDFGKGNALEPAKEYGTVSLDILKKQFTVN